MSLLLQQGHRALQHHQLCYVLGLWDKVTKGKAHPESCCSPQPLHKTISSIGSIQNYPYVLSLYLKDLPN